MDNRWKFLYCKVSEERGHGVETRAGREARSKRKRRPGPKDWPATEGVTGSEI